MGYVALWSAHAAASLLLVALLTACAARLRKAGPAVGLYALGMFLLAAAHVGALGLAAWGRAKMGAGLWLVGYGGALAAVVPAGVGAICAWGLRRRDDGARRAAGWRRARLAAAFCAAVGLWAATFWWLDFSTRRRLGSLRQQAEALARAAAPVRPPDGENAAPLYRRAGALLCPADHAPEGWQDRWDDWLDGNSPFDPADTAVGAFLERHAPALDLLRRAAEKPGCYFDELPYADPEMNQAVPGLRRYLRGLKALALSARALAAHGDIPGALRDANCLFAVGGHLADAAVLLFMLLGANADMLGFQTLQGVLPADANEAVLAAVRISPGVSYGRILPRSVRMEESFRLWCLACFDGRGSDGPGIALPSMGGPLGPFYRVFLLPDDLAGHARLSRRCRRLAEMPYWQAGPLWEQVEAEIASGPAGPLTKLLMPALGPVARRAAAAEACRRVARAALAAARYRARAGRLPAGPAELGEPLPPDPCDGKPLRWKRTGEGLVIYSVGPDGADDGGAPLTRKASPGDVSFTLPAR